MFLQNPASVYDVTQRSTFESLLNWLKEIEMYTARGKQCMKLLVGNKVWLAVMYLSIRYNIELALL